MSKVGLLISTHYPMYRLGKMSSLRIEKVATPDFAWSCYGSRVQLPTGVLVPDSCLWIVTDRGSELHNECSLLVFGHENMVSG